LDLGENEVERRKIQIQKFLDFDSTTNRNGTISFPKYPVFSPNAKLWNFWFEISDLGSAVLMTLKF